MVKSIVGHKLNVVLDSKAPLGHSRVTHCMGPNSAHIGRPKRKCGMTDGFTVRGVRSNPTAVTTFLFFFFFLLLCSNGSSKSNNTIQSSDF